MRFRLKPKSWLRWILILFVIVNTGTNLVLLNLLSRVYEINDDFKADITSLSLQYKIKSDGLKLPSVKIEKFISAYAYPEPSWAALTKDGKLLVAVNLDLVNSLSGSELEAVIAHEMGHYILGHFKQPYNSYLGRRQRNIKEEIEADKFAAKYAGIEAIVSAITKLSGDENETNIRLDTLDGK